MTGLPGATSQNAGLFITILTIETKMEALLWLRKQKEKTLEALLALATYPTKDM